MHDLHSTCWQENGARGKLRLTLLPSRGLRLFPLREEFPAQLFGQLLDPLQSVAQVFG